MGNQRSGDLIVGADPLSAGTKHKDKIENKVAGTKLREWFPSCLCPCIFLGVALLLLFRERAEIAIDEGRERFQHETVPGRAGSEPETGKVPDGEYQINAPAMS
jgi:hypothetical protein